MDEHHDIADIAFSFVVPVFNEAQSLPEFYSKLRQAVDELGQSYEIIFIDNGSTDESPEIIHDLHEKDDCVKYVTFSRNFGSVEAITAGYDYATGLAVISIDADGRHHPEVIAELIAKWRQGYEVVCTVKTRTEEASLPRRLARRCVNGLARWLTGMDLADQSDFRLLDRKVVEVLRQVRARSRFLRGLVRWVGFRQAEVPYVPAGDMAGKPAPIRSAGLFDLSMMPLRLIGLTGAAMAAVAILYGVIALILWSFLGGAVLANLVMLAVGLTGMQLAAIGICGEYVGRIYDEARGRPVYVVRQAVGFEPDEEEIQPQPEPTPSAASTEPSKIRLFT